MWARPSLLAAALFSIAFPAQAAAQRCSRDDVAALHQYCEQLPGAEGPTGVSGVRITLRERLPREVREQLLDVGPEGTALLALPVGVIRPPANRPRGPLPSASGAVSGSLAESRAGDGVVGRAVGAIADSGLSGVFRWALVLSALFVAGTAWMRLRS